MKRLIIALTLAAMSGCASLNYAGNSTMKVQLYVDRNGAKQCCSWEIRNGKEIGEITADVSIKPDGSFKGHLHELSVKAFQGQKIIADVAKTGIRAGAATAAAISSSISGLICSGLVGQGAVFIFGLGITMTL